MLFHGFLLHFFCCTSIQIFAVNFNFDLCSQKNTRLVDIFTFYWTSSNKKKIRKLKRLKDLIKTKSIYLENDEINLKSVKQW